MFLESDISFTSNAKIRFADNLVRKVNNSYPRISVSKLENFKNTEKFQNYILKLRGNLNWQRSKFAAFAKDKRGDYLAQWKYLADNIKLYRTGNCQESANLTEIAARVNNINNCQLAQLKLLTKDNKVFPLDHVVLLVNDKKPYIIDAWLGFADFLPNAFKRFKYEFSRFIGLNLSEEQNLFLEAQGKKHDISNELLLKLKDTFSELIIK